MQIVRLMAGAKPLPWLAGGLLVTAGLAGIAINNRAYDRALAGCEAAHAREQAKAAAKAAQEAARRQEAVDKADSAAAAGIAAHSRVERHFVEKVREVYRDRPDPVCVDADGMRLIQEADRAAGAAGAAGIGHDAVRAAEAGRELARQ